MRSTPSLGWTRGGGSACAARARWRAAWTRTSAGAPRRSRPPCAGSPRPRRPRTGGGTATGLRPRRWNRRCCRATSRAACCGCWCTSRGRAVCSTSACSPATPRWPWPRRSPRTGRWWPARSTRTSRRSPRSASPRPPTATRSTSAWGPRSGRWPSSPPTRRSTWSSSTPTRRATSSTSPRCSTPACSRRTACCAWTTPSCRASPTCPAAPRPTARPSPSSTTWSPPTRASSRCCSRCATGSR